MKRLLCCALVGSLLLCMLGAFAEADTQAARELEGMEGLVPIGAEMLNEGEYSIDVDTTSSMFRVEDCTLTVKDGTMTARMTMSGKGYLYVFMGTGEQADAAGESALIPFEVESDGRHSYTVPVEALDCALDCTAFSKKREKWYDRQIVFRSASLPPEALKTEGEMTAPDLEDGDYTVEATLSGGSGHTTIESPAYLTVRGGEVFLTVVFSSKNYDYMIVNGEKYIFEPDGGNSTFVIPVATFDRPLTVKADTVAMSTPHEIDYTIAVDPATLQRVDP